MSIDVLILLFVLFSAISSIVKKFRDRSDAEAPPRPVRRQELPDDEDEIDLSEWDVYREPDPIPQASPVDRGEFQEIRGTRPVEEPRDIVEEFREIRGERPVDEAPGSLPEFLEVRGRRQIADEAPGELKVRRESRDVRRPTLASARRRRRIRLSLSRDSLRKAILYNEILGPPRAEKMPW